MSRHARAQVLCAALVMFSAHAAHAGPITIDLPTALARARERAPDAIAARARAVEAEAARAGAAIRFTQNPELEIGAGPRFGDPTNLTIEARIEQSLELGRRGARMRVANAGVDHAVATADAEIRALGLVIATTFHEARYAELLVELTRRGEQLAARATDVAERRRKAGDITDLDVDLAKVARGRARSAVAAAVAERAAAIGKLAVLIGAAPDDVITLSGELRSSAVTLEGLRAGLGERADVRALGAESRLATAEGSLATAKGRTNVAVWIGYERDETETILLGGLRLTLPVWNRAQDGVAAASARMKRATLERDAISAAAARQVVDAFETYTRAREAVELFESDVLPALVDSELLLEKSVETGQLTVSVYLVARQEILAGRREHLDRQLALAKAADVARFVAGVMP